MYVPFALVVVVDVVCPRDRIVVILYFSVVVSGDDDVVLDIAINAREWFPLMMLIIILLHLWRRWVYRQLCSSSLSIVR